MMNFETIKIKDWIYAGRPILNLWGVELQTKLWCEVAGVIGGCQSDVSQLVQMCNRSCESTDWITSNHYTVMSTISFWCHE